MTAPEGGLYRALVWSLAALLGATGVLLMIQMIGAEIGPFRFAELGSRDPRSRVGLWLGAANGAQRWRVLLGNAGAVRDVGSLEALDPAELGVVVLPEPREIGAREFVLLQEFLAGGGGVVLTGSIGVRGPDGSWRGYELMRALLGAEVIALDPERAQAVVAARRGPLSAPLLPRERVAVAREPGLPGLAQAGSELVWSAALESANLALDAAGPLADATSAPAASLRREVGRGRLAWLAVGPERVARGADPQPLGDALRAAVAWAARQPFVEVLPWPGGAPFAASLDAQGAPPPDSVAAQRALEAEIATASASGGLARLRVPADWLAAGEGQRAFADELAQRGAWLATRSELSSWTRERASVQATVRRAGPQRLVVAVTNRAPSQARGVALRIYLNEPARSASVEATQLLQAAPGLRFQPAAESLDLALPELAPRASAAFTLDYEPAAG